MRLVWSRGYCGCVLPPSGDRILLKLVRKDPAPCVGWIVPPG